MIRPPFNLGMRPSNQRRSMTLLQNYKSVAAAPQLVE
jgi:hypothetical protein